MITVKSFYHVTITLWDGSVKTYPRVRAISDLAAKRQVLAWLHITWTNPRVYWELEYYEEYK